MKAGLASSLVLHVALIGFGLVSLSSPRALEVADVEAFPVDIIPVESLTQIQEGDKKAPMGEKPAPVPTKKPVAVAEAKEVGDNEVDTGKPAVPLPRPRPVETAAVPPPSPRPEPKPAQPKPETVKQREPKPAAAPATELLPEPEPKQDVKPDPAPETSVADAPDAETLKLPDTAPVPQPRPRPQPPKAQTAKAPEREDTEEPAKEAAAQPKSEEKEFDADEVAALLSKEKPSGGGAKRSDQTASLGGKKTTSGSKLSQSEMDALRGQLAGCWNLPGAGGGDDLNGLRASIRFRVDPTGKVDGPPTVEASSGNSIFDESALRAIRKCDSRGLILPKDKSDVWSEIVVNFDPTDMLF